MTGDRQSLSASPNEMTREIWNVLLMTPHEAFRLISLTRRPGALLLIVIVRGRAHRLTGARRAHQDRAAARHL